MKERLVTLGLALAALGVFYLVLVPKPRPEHAGTSRPVSTDAAGAGYLGLRRWLEAEKVPVSVLTERYDRLDRAAPSSGNVLFLTMPFAVAARRDERARLDEWVRRGNTLVVSAALADTPAWSLGNARFLQSVREMTGLEFTAVAETAGEAREAQPQRISEQLGAMIDGKRSTIVPNGPHPLMAGVASVNVVSELPALRWNGQSADGSMALELARFAGNGDPALWLRGRGAGQVIVLAAASPFSNALIGEGDNARLLGNVLAWSRAPGGVVIFDDGHQGALREYDAGRFFADPRLHWTLAWLVLLWLVFVLGVQPLRARPRNWNPIDITAFLTLSGDSLASAVGPRAVGLRLVQNFSDDLDRRLDRPGPGEPPWPWLARQANVRRADIDELTKLHARLLSGRRVDLVRLQSLISRLKGSLS